MKLISRLFQLRPDLKTLISVDEKGQALTFLLVFAMVAIITTTGAVAVVVSNTQSAGSFLGGEKALFMAETGADNAILRLLRDPNYTGETLSIDGSNVTITVLGSGTKTITSEAVIGNYQRQIQVIGSLQNNNFTITSWEEIN